MADPKPAELGILGQLLGDHLDAGYDEAHQRRGGEPPKRRSHRAWLVGGALLAGLLMGVAASDAGQRAPDADQARRSLADDVQAARANTEELSRRAAELAQSLDQARGRALDGDEAGRAELDRLTALNQAAGAVAVRGPGLLITVRDPIEARGGQNHQNILDRDLQVLVNALWSSGAEAVAVGGVRLQPRATIRQAGGAMLVDNRPITQPYLLEAIGSPAEMRDALALTEASRRFLGFAADYGTVYTVETRDELRLAAAGITEGRMAATVTRPPVSSTTQPPPRSTTPPTSTTGGKR
ncbi:MULTISPECIES: DUF881 domain-containing protein [unclassified Crossiella]|uniref:DUF881 domain-containing protein n=1 Tax=unclassified Crossiella TaxID=2620835 RepID=UPI001FFF5605|nr:MULTISPECIES: DUF881 domain-containing protein [unclassified Crossiella]MCK2242037.1 DUF881 domain-containing protein [Crossiella sp. S99.2]MCK2255940.1 DUF881 domain-containing protein [Crossiella sp. S99.1]